MPIYLEPRDVAADLEGFKSVLIVSCPICPPDVEWAPWAGQDRD